MTNQAFNLDTLQHAKQKAIDLGAAFAPKLIVALIILTAGFFVARWVGDVFSRWLDKLKLEPPVRLLMLRLVRLLVMGLFVIMALSNLGVDLIPLIAGLGVAGAGVALAMQGVLGNLAAGLTIIFTKPFRVGEYVSMVGVEGRVETIELFCTKLSHPDLSTVIIPNRKIVGEILHNYGKIRQLDVVVGVAYDTDLNKALAAVDAVLKLNSRVLQDPAPVVRVSYLADSSINIMVKPWVNVPDYGLVSGEVNKAIVEEFRARRIAIPFPQREVRLLNPAT
ncbi:MAG: mechanosensitive ion channel family protein [Verrucomicrobiota bacterium]